MAIIKCVECNNDVSDQAKVCPHCGYNLKSKKKVLKKVFNLKPKISNAMIILYVLFICSFALLFVDGTYCIEWKEGYSVSARHNYDLYNLIQYVLGDFIGFLNLILVISFIVKVIYDFKPKFIEKKKKLMAKITNVFYISLAIFDLIAIFLLLYVNIANVKNGGYVRSKFGAVWIAIMAVVSIVMIFVERSINKTREAQEKKQELATMIEDIDEQLSKDNEQVVDEKPAEEDIKEPVEENNKEEVIKEDNNGGE